MESPDNRHQIPLSTAEEMQQIVSGMEETGKLASLLREPEGIWDAHWLQKHMIVQIAEAEGIISREQNLRNCPADVRIRCGDTLVTPKDFANGDQKRRGPLYS